MRGVGVVRWIGAAAACCGAVAGCATAKWSGEHRVEYRMPQRFFLSVDVTDQVRTGDRAGAVAELAGALHRDIWRRGYDASLVSPIVGRDRYPRVEVLVRQWHPTSDKIDWFGGAGHAEIDADCSVLMTPNASPVFAGRIRGRLDLADYALSATSASDAAADAIAGEVLGPNGRERPVPMPYAPPAPSSAVRVAAPAPGSHPATAAAAVSAAQPRPLAPSAMPSPPPSPVTAAAAATTVPAVPTQSFPLD